MIFIKSSPLHIWLSIRQILIPSSLSLNQVSIFNIGRIFIFIIDILILFELFFGGEKRVGVVVHPLSFQLFLLHLIYSVFLVTRQLLL